MAHTNDKNNTKIDGNFIVKKCVLRALLVLLLVFNVSMGLAGEKPPAKVVVSKIILEKIARDHEFLGTLYYDRISHISSEVSGLVASIRVREGQRVKKGSPIIYLDTEILEKEITIHQNQIGLGRLNISHLEKKFARMKALFEKGSASEMIYDDAQFAHQDALLKLLSTQMSLEKLLINKRKSVINAPFDGVILEKKVDSGDWVNPGKSLVDIGSINDLFIKVPVSETLLQFLNIGQKVDVTINAYNKQLTGVIENLSPFADVKTKNVFLKIRIPPLKKIAQNMSASVRVPTGKPEVLAMIPRDALVKFQGNDFVYTIKEKKAVMLPVNIVRYKGKQVGADNPHFTAGMSIVVDGNERLRSGQAVEVSPVVIHRKK